MMIAVDMTEMIPTTCMNIPARGNRESGKMETAIPVEREPLFR